MRWRGAAVRTLAAGGAEVGRLLGLHADAIPREVLARYPGPIP